VGKTALMLEFGPRAPARGFMPIAIEARVA
jgi:hypothetical protein